jgi:hypothetical protein
MDIEIKLVSESPDSKEISLTTNAIFLVQKSRSPMSYPVYGAVIFKRQESQTDDGRNLYAPMYRMNESPLNLAWKHHSGSTRRVGLRQVLRNE